MVFRMKSCICRDCRDEQQEEPYEGRLSSTVLWEGKGEIPLPDPLE